MFNKNIIFIIFEKNRTCDFMCIIVDNQYLIVAQRIIFIVKNNDTLDWEFVKRRYN